MLDNNNGWFMFDNYIGISIYEKFLSRTKSQRKRRKFARNTGRRKRK